MLADMVKSIIDWIEQIGRYKKIGFKMKLDPIIDNYIFIPTYNRKLLRERRRR